MISGISGSSPTPLSAAQSALDKDDFLELLVTQLRHQDPLDPMDPTGFASQLAEFSSLEQLIQLNERSAAASELDAMTTLSLNANLAATLLGREVITLGSRIEVGPSKHASVTVDVVGDGGTGVIRLLDSAGREITTHDVGPLKGGRQTIELDDIAVPKGVYSYELVVLDGDGAPIPVTPYSGGIVTGVEFAPEGVMLRVGELLVPINQLVEVSVAADEGK